jgi:hypothetical protein
LIEGIANTGPDGRRLSDYFGIAAGIEAAF